jgi:superfamily II DNA or RNA helicase
MTYNNLYIVDNDSEDQSVKQYLSEWCDISKQMDIATGYLEIGGLLEIDEKWQKLDKIRIILGSEVTKRTKLVIDAAIEALVNRLDRSLENEKERNEFLLGVPAILEAFKSGKIECRVFDKDKFHAKAYITHFSDDYHKKFPVSMNIPKGYALVGSSNFTKAGLTQNIELNVQVSNNVDQLQTWFEEHWNRAEDISEAILKVIETHCREYTPYEIYLKSMYEYFKGTEQTITDWEAKESVVYHVLSQYQIDGYNSMVKIADKYAGAFLCDGVGLGKTFVGMMLIERFVKKERKNVVLIVPAASRASVWEVNIKKYIPEILEGFYSFKIINHTDILLEKNQNLMRKISEQAERIIIDEAHHFRNRTSGRYRKLYEIIGQGCKKQMYMLTATPVNNSFLDLQHLIELFTQRVDDYFKVPPLGIHSLTGHFRKLEAKLVQLTEDSNANIVDDSIEADLVFKDDRLVNELVVQRSRAYVKKSLTAIEGYNVLFPDRLPPAVAQYSLKRSYGRLIDDFVSSFYRKDLETGRQIPILALAVYSPYSSIYYIGDINKIDYMKQGRQVQVVNLIRQLLLKRFESSTAAFEETCIRIFVRLRKFIEDFKEFGNVREIDRFLLRQERVLIYINLFLENNTEYTTDELEDNLPDYIWDVDEDVNIEDFNVAVMIQDTLGDLEILSGFISDLMVIDPENDDKMNVLKDILRNDTRVRNKKVIIFTEYRSTALYINRELKKANFARVFELDGQSKENRRDIIERFSPYYNDKTSATVENEINILIATDVLSEGLNLQDATCVINYELHWNPVRLMQRIGRVDRRRNRAIEDLLLADHPEVTADRNLIFYWNFLPPIELESLLSLYQTVSKKALRISKTFGIEGKQLLTPEDDFEALKDFNSAYEGTESHEEEMTLEYQKLIVGNTNLESVLKAFPQKIFSGKNSISRKGIFFCYELPVKNAAGEWSEGNGIYRWYILDRNTQDILFNIYDIWQIIKSTSSELRVLDISEEYFSKERKIVEAYINKSYMRNIQAPIGVLPRLVTWMQLK